MFRSNVIRTTEWERLPSLSWYFFSKVPFWNYLISYVQLCSSYVQSSQAGVLRKRFSENMQQIYWRTPMPKCDFNKVALQLYWNHTSTWVFSCKFSDHLFLRTRPDGCFWKFFRNDYEALWQRHLKDTLQLKILWTWIIIVANSFLTKYL